MIMSTPLVGPFALRPKSFTFFAVVISPTSPTLTFSILAPSAMPCASFGRKAFRSAAVLPSLEGTMEKLNFEPSPASQSRLPSLSGLAVQSSGSVMLKAGSFSGYLIVLALRFRAVARRRVAVRRRKFFIFVPLYWLPPGHASRCFGPIENLFTADCADITDQGLKANFHKTR